MVRALCGLLISLSAWLAMAAHAAPDAAAAAEDACDPPLRFAWVDRESEAPAADQWRLAGTGDRLVEDACGHVWALWFNSWEVHQRGDPKRRGSLHMPYEGALAALTASGVSDFAPVPGALWIVGRNGQFGRRDHAGWHHLPSLPECRDGRLLMVASRLWMSCGVVGGHALAYRDASSGDWRVARRAAGTRPLLVASGARAYALTSTALMPIDGARLGPAQSLALAIEPTSAAIDASRIVVGSDDGIFVHSRDDGAVRHHLPGAVITGVALDAQGGVWAAQRDAGLHHHDGTHWRRWRYAQGLPDDEARDLLIDGNGSLWLAGTPSAVIAARAAAWRLRALSMPAAIAGSVHADACAAADAVLGARALSGDIAQVDVAGQKLVFFESRQVCPDPWRGRHDDTLHWRRPLDGAVLAVGHNGRSGSFHCGSPCDPAATSMLERAWQLVIHQPVDAAPESPLRAIALAPPRPLPKYSPSASLLLTRAGEVWIAADDGSLYQHDGASWWEVGASAGLAANNRAMDLIEGNDGAIWVASSPTWLRAQQRYSGTPLHRRKLRRWRDLDLVGAGVGSSWSLWSLRAIADGVLVAGNGGVLQANPQGKVDTASGLRGGTYTALGIDPEGRWWALRGMGAPGLSVRVDGQWRHLSSREGLHADHWRALGHDDQQRVWLLAADGSVAVHSRAVLLQHSVE